MWTRRVLSIVLVLGMVSSLFVVGSLTVSANTGTPDAYGYRWTDSKSTQPNVTFNWIEISSTGTKGSGGDDLWYGSYPIGFNFYFYGNRYTAFNYSTNGYIQFAGGSSSLSNTNIPSTGSPNNFIAGYWDDDYVDTAVGGVYRQTIGSEPNRQLVVEYYNIRLWGGSTYFSFEIILNETGEIWIQYDYLNGITGYYATVGIENAGGTQGCLYSYYQYMIQDHLAVKFDLGPMTFGPSLTSTGRPSTSVFYNMTLQNRQGSSDSFALTTSCAAGWTATLYDSTMTLLVDTDGDLVIDSGSLASKATMTVTVVVDIPASPTVASAITFVTAASHANATVNDTHTLTTVVAKAWFTPPMTDWGLDTNSDGLYDYLVIQADFYVFTPGWYEVTADLYTSWPSYIGNAYNSSSFLAAGSYSFTLRYYGYAIRATGYDGPYMADLELYDNTWTLMDTSTHDTAAYPDTDFMTYPVQLSPPYTDTAVDTDSDSLYDYLEVDIPVQVNYDATTYVLQVNLDDVGGHQMSFQQIRVDSASVGTATTHLRFSAFDITRNCTDGSPFDVSMWLYWINGMSWLNMDYDWYTTAAYSLSSFDRPGALIMPDYSYYGNDTDFDGDYNSLDVYVSVNVTTAGVYTLTGLLHEWDDIDTITITQYFNTGVTELLLRYPGWHIRYADEVGDYYVDVTLTDALGDMMDMDSFDVGFYWYSDFENAPGAFDWPHYAYRVNNSGDALYDELVVWANVTVDEAGTFVIQADLSSWASLIDTQINTTYLTVGPHAVELRFPGWLIREEGISDTYDIDLYLRDEGNRQMDTDWFSTPYWLYTDFSYPPGVLVTPFSSYGLDDDSDGLFEWLVINASVDSTVTDEVYLECYLDDPSYDWMGTAGDRMLLGIGETEMQVRFPGWQIRAAMANGSYGAYLTLYDSQMDEMDSNSFWTTNYDWTLFDPTVPRIVSSWAFSVPTVDGSFDAAEWSGATVVDLAGVIDVNSLGAKLMVKNDASKLYILYDAWSDITNDNGDRAEVSFDTGNDNAATDGTEDVFLVGGSWYQPTHYLYNEASVSWLMDCQPFDATGDHAGLAGAAGFGPSSASATAHRIYEFAIPLAMLETSQGSVIGFLGDWFSPFDQGGVFDANNGTLSSWPALGPPDIANYGELQLATYTSIPAPVTTATLTGTAGTNGWYTSAVGATLSATGGAGGVNYTQYRIDGGTWMTYNSQLTFSSAGTFLLEFMSADFDDQIETTKSVTVKIDLVKPVTTAGKSGAMVWLNSTDGVSGIQDTMYRIDGGAWLNYTASFEVTGVGNHTIEFYSTDAAGNSEAVKSIVVEVKESGKSGGVAGLPLMWILLIVAIIAAALILVFFLMRKKKEPQPMQTPQWQPTQPMQPVQGPPPPPPAQ